MKKGIIAVLVLLVLVLAVGGYVVLNRSVKQDPVTETTAQVPQAQEEVAQTEAPTETAAADAPAEAAAQSDVQETDMEQENKDVFTLSGQITEVTDEFLMLEDSQLGQVQVGISDDTQMELMHTEALSAGQYAVILYSGMMTRSVPPQVTALRVGVYAYVGTVAQVEEDGRVLLTQKDTGEQVLAALPEGTQTLSEGDNVTLYTNGVSTMSIPAQVNAIGVTVEQK